MAGKMPFHSRWRAAKESRRKRPDVFELCCRARREKNRKSRNRAAASINSQFNKQFNLLSSPFLNIFISNKWVIAAGTSVSLEYRFQSVIRGLTFWKTSHISHSNFGRQVWISPLTSFSVSHQLSHQLLKSLEHLSGGWTNSAGRPNL